MIELNNSSNITVDGKTYDSFTEPPVLMAQERKKTNFSVRDMTYYLYGGKKATEDLEVLMQQIERSPAFDNTDYYDVIGNYAECRERTMAKVGAVAQLVTDGRSEQDIQRFLSLIGISDPAAYTRIGVHFGLFLSGVRSSGTPEQFNYWVAQGAAGLRNFFGCFCMTEIGHGSNVAGLETTATYDPSTQEFVVNTPTVAATKWWIGGAAHTATHSLCYARLIVNGKDYGTRNFVVPLRDPASWNLLPGISIGDIGKKMGRDGIDNGWVQYSNVRIPRLYLMSKFVKVSEDGTVTQKAPAQLALGALIGGRVSMTHDSFTWASRFLTIAIRYACVRRQFSQDSDVETKIIDYTYHQRRLLPRLAYAFAMNAGSRELSEVHQATTQALQNVNTKDQAALDKAVGETKVLFALSAGLKAFSTWGTLQTIEECRQACGGHGYSAYNGFVDWNAFAVQVTWEGDNTILALSAGRALISRALDSKSSVQKPNSSNLTDAKTLIDGWNYVYEKAIEQAVKQYHEFIKSGKSQEVTWESLSQSRFRVTKLRTRSFLVRAFFAQIDATVKDSSVKKVLYELATLFALWSIEEEASAFLEYEFLKPEELTQVTVLVNDFCGRVREQAIGLTDSFNWPDFFINSAIGNFDGDVYRNYFKKVNDRNPKSKTHAPYYKSVMEPFFKRQDIPEPDLADIEEEERDE